MTAWEGEPEPIARELLQNALDASREAGRERAEVSFSIGRVPLGRIPGLATYREHFANAEREHGRNATGPARTVIERIDAALSADEVALLMCRDNGVGLNGDRMLGILSEGSSRKSLEQTGSYGVGHLTAFSASDLRYVLYAGRSWGPDGLIDEISSGHAILASQGRDGQHGFWLQKQTLFDENPYPSKIPPILMSEVDEIANTGSVVCMVGFNRFHDEEDPKLLLRWAAAAHFLAAIHRDEMTVEVREDGHATLRVDRNTLPAVLDNVPRNRGDSRGFSNEFVQRAWQTLEEGEEFNVLDAEVRFRPLEGTGQRDSRVHVFRNGMWISSDVSQFRTHNFGGYRPFDAVVLLDRGELYELVYGAEGPEHLGVIPKRLGNNIKRNRLNKLLRDLRDELRALAGKDVTPERVTLANFAVVRGGGLRAAERVRRRRPRRTPDEEQPAPEPNGGEDDPSTSSNGSGKKSERKRSTSSPASGRAAALQSSVVPRRNDRGEIESLSVRWRFTDEKLPSAVGVRVFLPSGSDQTCDQPLSPEWVRLGEIRDMDGNLLGVARAATGAEELVVPPGGEGISILPRSPLPADASPALDVVRRKAS